jgi:hypothetical protein
MKITIGNLMLAALPIAAIAAALGFAHLDQRAEQQRAAEYEATARAYAESERVAERARFEQGSTEQRLAYCLEKLPQRPLVGIAIHRERIDALYVWGPSMRGLRRYACDGSGLSEAHVDAPLPYRIWESDADGEQRVLSAARAALNTAELVEVVLTADRVVLRRSNFDSGRAISDIVPADTVDFPWISSAPPVQALAAGQSAIAGLREWPTHRWLHEHELALQHLGSVLAPELLSRVTRLDLHDDRMSIAFQGPAVHLDAAYIEIEIDRYGVASWPAPFAEPPGFSCARGLALDDIRQQFVEACRIRGCRDDRRPTIATYGCSGGAGAWTIRLPRLRQGFF